MGQKPFGVIYTPDRRRIVTASKEVFLGLVEEYAEPMDVIGALGGLKWWNPLTWFGRWVESETDAPIGHAEVVGEKDASTEAVTVYSTDFHFKQVPLLPELRKQARIIIKRMPRLTPQQVQTGLNTLHHFVGMPYPAETVIEMKLQSLLDPEAYKLWYVSKAPICSQSVGYAYNTMDCPISPGLGKHWSKLTPIDVLSDDRMEVIAYWDWPLPAGQYLQ
jgi:hypothetical protein